MIVAVAALAAITIAIKGAAALAGEIPEPLANRLAGLAPALLAALVVTQLSGDNGLPAIDAKAAGVAAALVLAWRRAPFAVCVVAGAAVAAAIRALT